MTSNEMICYQVTLSGSAEWPKVADAVIEAAFGPDHGTGHLGPLRSTPQLAVVD